MDELFGAIQYTPEQLSSLKEMERRANDRIRVYNPTNEDFITRWDGVGFRVPGKSTDLGQGPGQAILPRYVAINYVQHMVDKLFEDARVVAIRTENDKRAEAGMKEMSKDTEQPGFELSWQTQHQNDKKMMVPTLWLGIEEEYGLDLETTQQKTQEDDLDRQLRAMMDRRAVPLQGGETPNNPLFSTPNAGGVSQTITPINPVSAAPIQDAAAPQAPAAPLPQAATPQVNSDLPPIESIQAQADAIAQNLSQ